MRDLLEYAQDQQWKVNPKGDHRYVFVAPSDAARPGLSAIAVDDPFSNSHSQKVIRSRLRQAGFKFESIEEKSEPVTTSKTNGSHAPSLVSEVTSPFARARQKINQAVTLLSEIEQELATIERDTEKEQKLRELLKGYLK